MVVRPTVLTWHREAFNAGESHVDFKNIPAEAMAILKAEAAAKEPKEEKKAKESKE